MSQENNVKNSSKTNIKNNALDTVRLVAICAVILLHTVSGILDNYPDQMTEIQISVYSLIKYMCEIGVPLFLMVSGALMLDPERELSWEKLHRKNIRRLVLALLIFGTVFALSEGIYNCYFCSGFKKLKEAEGIIGYLASSGKIGKFLSVFLTSLKAVFTGDSWAHLWYMYVIIGIYLILPLLRVFVAKVEEKILGFLILLLVFMQSVVPMIGEVLEWKIEFGLPINGIYLTYFLLGYYLWKFRPFESDAENRKLLYQTSIFLVVLAVMISFAPEGTKIEYWSPIVLFISMAVFTKIITPAGDGTAKKKQNNDFIYSIRSMSFGMYLIHTVFLNFCYKFLGITPLLCGGYVLIPVIAVIDFAFAYVGAWIMKKIPWFGKNVV